MSEHADQFPELMTNPDSPRLETRLVDPFFAPEPLQSLLGSAANVTLGEPGAAHPETAVVITVDRPISAHELTHLENLRLVIAASVGFEHVDLDGLRKRGVKVCHAPSYCTEEVADHTIAAVLALLRGLQRFDRATQAKQWDIQTGGRVARIAGRQLGIVGLGRIGSGVARRAKALGMDVIATDRFHDVEAAPKGVRLVSLHELLREAEVVSLHATAREDMRPLIGANELALMRPGALLVNTARAALVDLDALAEHLNNGHLGAAHFDVWDNEPPRWHDARLRSANLFLSPHVGWLSDRSEMSLWQEVAQAINATRCGRDPPNRLA